MDYKEKAEEFFEAIITRKKSLVEIPLNCSQGETGALLYLTYKENGISASKLSDILDVSMPRVVSIINSLENKKLIEKIVDKEDKRKTNIYITEMGKQIVIEKKEEAIQNIIKIMKELTEDEINEYIRLTKKLGLIMNDKMQD